jgi:large subunit ribosomal protein L29
MNIEKIRNLGPDELLHQQREAADQLFRLRFQLKMGQTTGLKKMRELRKDLARIKTISRERELGITVSSVNDATASATSPQAAAATATRSPRKITGTPAKKAVGKKKAAAAPKKIAAKKGKAKK